MTLKDWEHYCKTGRLNDAMIVLPSVIENKSFLIGLQLSVLYNHSRIADEAIRRYPLIKTKLRNLSQRVVPVCVAKYINTL